MFDKLGKVKYRWRFKEEFMTFQLLYISTASSLMSESKLAELLNEAREFNLAHNITGMLLYLDGNFVQVLEGAEGDVQKLYARIELDVRHHNPRICYTNEVHEREFPEWAMGFRSENGLSPEQLPGFNSLPDWHKSISQEPLPRGSLRKMLLSMVNASRDV